MSEYYLVSQLPSLDGLGENVPLPITEEYFIELCQRFLGEKAWEKMKNITLIPPKNGTSTGSVLIDSWFSSEKLLRIALANVRAQRLKKSFDVGSVAIPPEYVKAAAVAIEAENPLEAEEYLNSFRFSILEGLRPSDIFSKEYIFYYAIKLKLLSRLRCFDKNAGEKAYKKIYSSVIDRGITEA